MKESYDEGLASHIGPESCGCRREVAREALTGVPAGVDTEPRNHPIPGADLVEARGRQHRLTRGQRRRNGGLPVQRQTSTELLPARLASYQAVLARSKTHCTQGNSMYRTGEISSCTPTCPWQAGPQWEGRTSFSLSHR